MAYAQTRNFNQSTAGRVVGDCLENVRKGYGIAAKYLDAWAAWEATDKHTEALPVGVAVPAFFSYDGPSNGHIGVSLGNGQFWSDGIVYASIAAFEAEHTPRYVGWSTSVDGVAVAESVAAPVSVGHTINLPANSGAWHLYKPGGPYNPNNAADVIAVVHPADYAPAGLTYQIVSNLGNGVYRINSLLHGEADLWTNGSEVIVK